MRLWKTWENIPNYANYAIPRYLGFLNEGQYFTDLDFDCFAMPELKLKLPLFTCITLH